jgi:hypothetical protein
MKKLLLAAAFLIPLIAGAQSSNPFGYKSEDKYVYYGDVVKVDTSFTATDLYKSAKMFITKLALTNTKITADDKAAGLVTADVEEKATFKTQTGIGSEPMTLKYSIKLELKQGRYRYTFDNIQITYLDNNDKNTVRTLYDIDKERTSGLLGNGRDKRIIKAMDALFLSKIDLLTGTMKKKSDDF